MSGHVAQRRPEPLSPVMSLVALVDVLAKAVLLVLILLVFLNPEWGNLEGKSPNARAVTYPALAFAVPLWCWLRRKTGPYPWVADLLLTFTGFSDVLGNRLDLYDMVTWFDDWMHFMNAGLVAAAALLLMGERDATLHQSIDRAIAVGMTASLAWELFEYLTFLTKSREYPMAYVDTLGDLVLGWCGAFVAAFVVHRAWTRHPHLLGRHEARRSLSDRMGLGA